MVTDTKKYPRLPINSFDGEYRFLSNFYLTPVMFDGVMYRSLEHAYQAAKTLNSLQRQYIHNHCTRPGDAKKYGRRVTLRDGWDGMKIGLMLLLLHRKFLDPGLRRKLIETDDAELIEGNTWGDTYWGVYAGKGKNHLGRLLMQVRQECRAEEAGR